VKIGNLLGMVFGLVLIVSLLSIWLYPSVQDFMAGNTMWNGVRNFIAEYKAETIDSFNTLPGQPEATTLVSIPYTPYTVEELAQAKEFVDQGGTLVIMDDFGYGNGFLEYAALPARFTNSILLDPLFSYKNQYLPRITDFTQGIEESNVGLVVFDHATTISNVAAGNSLAWSSTMSFIDSNGNGIWDPDEAKGPFVVAAKYQSGKGTVELVSDPSIIINTMVERNDNDAFVHYLIFDGNAGAKVLLDRVHLTKAPLDTAKIDLAAVWKIISHPYTLVGITALVFVIITGYIYRKGLISG
jgi:hypothetical protein